MFHDVYYVKSYGASVLSTLDLADCSKFDHVQRSNERHYYPKTAFCGSS